MTTPEPCGCLCVATHPTTVGVCTADAETSFRLTPGGTPIHTCAACAHAWILGRPEPTMPDPWAPPIHPEADVPETSIGAVLGALRIIVGGPLREYVRAELDQLSGGRRLEGSYRALAETMDDAMAAADDLARLWALTHPRPADLDPMDPSTWSDPATTR